MIDNKKETPLSAYSEKKLIFLRILYFVAGVFMMATGLLLTLVSVCYCILAIIGVLLIRRSNSFKKMLVQNRQQSSTIPTVNAETNKIKGKNTQMKKTDKKNGKNWIVSFAIILILFAVIGRENENNDKTSQIQRTQKSETEVGKTNSNVSEKEKSESDRTVESEQIQNDNSLNSNVGETKESTTKETEGKNLANKKESNEAEEKVVKKSEKKVTKSKGAKDKNNNLGNESNFNTYNNSDQQNTSASYVLNTNTYKFHCPSCSQVKKIAPQNYATSDASKSDLTAQGYSPCGICEP